MVLKSLTLFQTKLFVFYTFWDQSPKFVDCMLSYIKITPYPGQKRETSCPISDQNTRIIYPHIYGLYVEFPPPPLLPGPSSSSYVSIAARVKNVLQCRVTHPALILGRNLTLAIILNLIIILIKIIQGFRVRLKTWFTALHVLNGWCDTHFSHEQLHPDFTQTK